MVFYDKQKRRKQNMGFLILTDTISCANMKMKFVFVSIGKMDRHFLSRV